MSNEDKINEYNSEPVYYCANCLSLGIVEEGGVEYCKECGSLAVCSTSIENWEYLYEKRYGKKFIKKNPKTY